MTEKGCDNCYYTYFDEKAYPCSLCIRGIERTDQWQPSKKTKADRKTENSSEKPNNCELQTIRCPKCGRTDYIRDMEKDMGIKGSHYKYKCINCNTYIKDEPTISKMEQVDKDINVRSKTEPQTEEWHDDCNTCRWHDGACTIPCCDYEPKTEPQTDNGIGCSKCESRFWCMDRDMPHAVHCNNYGKTEPSTDCSWK